MFFLPMNVYICYNNLNEDFGSNFSIDYVSWDEISGCKVQMLFFSRLVEKTHELNFPKHILLFWKRIQMYMINKNSL